MLIELPLLCTIAGRDSNDGYVPVVLEDGVLRGVLANGNCGLDAGEDRHVNIHENEVEFFCGEPFEGLDTRGHDDRPLDNIGKVLFEHAREDREVDRVIVNNHDLDLAQLIQLQGRVKTKGVEAVDAVDTHGRRGRRARGCDGGRHWH